MNNKYMLRAPPSIQSVRFPYNDKIAFVDSVPFHSLDMILACAKYQRILTFKLNEVRKADYHTYKRQY